MFIVIIFPTVEAGASWTFPPNIFLLYWFLNSCFVENPGVFAEAFVELNKGFSNGNYISLGMYTGGERNETHYIYTTHSDAKNQFTFFPDNEKEQKAFAKFQSSVSPISQFKGSLI